MSPFEGFYVGKTVVVTGAGKGVGRALAKELHRLGATVYAISRTKSDLDDLALQCPTTLLHTIALDLSNWDETKRVLTQKLPDKIHVLVNNAAVLDVHSHLEATAVDFDRVFSTNVKAVLNVTQICAKKMIGSKTEGTVINVSSVAAIRPAANYGLYSASKAALDSITKTMAVELGLFGIRVVGFNPGSIQTSMTALSSPPSRSEKETAEIEPQYAHRFPLGEAYVPMDQIVNTLLFLGSGLVRSMTGSSVVLDGGFLVT